MKYVVGANGYIGRSILCAARDRNQNVRSIGRNNADIAVNLEAVDRFDFGQIEPGSFVVFAAAISSPDLCEKEFERCWNINVEGTSHFIANVIEKSCRVVFFSSDAVYASEPEGVYDEDSETNPRFSYGKMKVAVESRFADVPLFTTVRLSYVFSGHDKTMSYMLSCLKKKKRASVFHPYYRNYISLSDVTRAVEWLERHPESVPNGRLNLAGVELVSKIRVADELRRIEPCFSYIIESPPANFFDVRPQITQMESKYLYELGICERRNFSEKFRNEMKGAVE